MRVGVIRGTKSSVVSDRTGSVAADRAGIDPQFEHGPKGAGGEGVVAHPTCHGHRSPISGIDVHHSGCVATAGYDSAVILWSALSGRVIAQRRHEHLVNQCRFSPDGRFLLTASSDYTARVWSVPSLDQVATLRGHFDDVEMASWSPDGKQIATASRDHSIGIFSPAGAQLATIRGHEADVLSVEWIDDGRRLVSSSDDGTVRIWDVETRTEVSRYELGGETDSVVRCRSDLLVAGNDRGELLVLHNGSVTVVPAHSAGIKRLVFNPDTWQLVSASYDRQIKLWSVTPSGGLHLVQTTIAPAPVWLRAAAFSTSDSVVFGTFGTSYATYSIATDSWDLSSVGPTPGTNAVEVWQGDTYTVGDAGVVRSNGEVVAELPGLCNFLHPVEATIVTGGQLGELYDARSGAVLHRHRSPLNCAASLRTSPHDRRFVVGSYTGEILLFDESDDGTISYIDQLPAHENAIKGLAAHAGELFSVCATGAAAVHKLETLSEVHAVSDGHHRIANAAATLPDGRFVSVSRDLLLRLWSPPIAECIETPHDHSIKCVAVHPGTGLVATGSYDGTVATYDPAARQWGPLQKLSRFGVSSIAPQPDCDGFLASCYSGEVFGFGSEQSPTLMIAADWEDGD